MSDVEAWTTALWIVHTHCNFQKDEETFRTTPYFWISSATKESGKTTLLRVLRSLSARPLMSSNISTGALNRVVETGHPTLLLDELDTVFKGNKERGEAIRGVLNSGFEYDGSVTMCEGEGHKVKTFSTYCPKALSGIGVLWDTVASRSIPVRLERKRSDEAVEYFDRDVVDPQAEKLRKQIAWWVEMVEPDLRGCRPESELDGRVQDLWRPMLAVADLASGDWPERARQAAAELSSGDAREDDSLNERLLADIRTIFNESPQVQRYKTADLITKLAEIEESPWGDWGRTGKPITAHALSRVLQPFRIRTMPVWVEGRTVKGYKREQFENAWSRHLPVQGEVREVSGVSPGPEIENDLTEPNPPNPSPNPGVSGNPALEAVPNSPNPPNPTLETLEGGDSVKTEAELEAEAARLVEQGMPEDLARVVAWGGRNLPANGNGHVQVVSPNGQVHIAEVIDEGNPEKEPVPSW
jgi:hypothetical protein